MPHDLHIDAFTSFTIAIVLLFVGRYLTQRIGLLRKYSIPEPVVGGLLCVLIVTAIHTLLNRQVRFEIDVRNYLLLYFFACIGLRSDVSTLRAGGKPLLILTFLAGTFIVLQNSLGMAVAQLFGLDARTGLMAGSISLTGGMGTTLAWAPEFTSRLGIQGAMEIGVASNMVGLIAACCIGGPIASFLMRRHHLTGSLNSQLMIGELKEHDTPVDYYGILRAWLWLNIALLLGSHLTSLIRSAGLNLPGFVGALLAGILIRNTLPYLMPKHFSFRVVDTRKGMAIISDICLGMFLIMALMDLRLWELKGSLGFLSVVLTCQVTLAVLFTIFVVYRAMGRDYEAAVICSGFGGITLGSTATAVANMTAVSREHGAANRAFLVVPLVCGFAVDLINAVVINFMIR